MRRLPLTLALAAWAALAAPAPAQNLFAPVARVGEQVVTRYELDQRAAFNQALGASGDLAALSLDQLIEDRLRLIAADLDGVEPTEEEVEEGMVEFAARADLSLEAFVALLAEAGVAEETFRDFVRAGLAFRLVVQARFGPQADVAEADIDRALSRVAPTGRLEVELAEIILPADTPERAAQSEALAAEIQAITGVEAFSAAAREVSFAATRDIGGRLDPLPIERLPPPIQEQLLSLAPGEVTDPIPLPDAVVLFQLRALREIGGTAEPPRAIDYAAFYIPGGRTPEALREAAALRASVDDCDDLYGAAEGLAPERLERGTQPLDAIPADVAAQLALLDPGEATATLTRAGGQTLVFLMLCERDPRPEADEVADVEGTSIAAPEAEDAPPPGAAPGQASAAEDGAGPAEAPSRDAVRSALRNQRLQSFADAYLDELRAEAGVEVLAQP